MKRLLAMLVIALSTALAALGTAGPAGAGGKPAYNCPPGFIGPVTLEQYLNLPRNQAGFAAGAYDVNNRTATFNATDKPNRDGMICAKDVASLGHVNPAVWQYFYDIVDDNSSAAPAS